MILSTRLGRRLQLSIASWMTIAIMLAATPMIVFASVVVYDLIQQREAEQKLNLERRAAGAARAVGQELKGVIQSLSTIGQGSHVLQGDAKAMYGFAKRVVASDPRLRSLSLNSGDGEQLFTTAEPYGARTQQELQADLRRVVIEGGNPHVAPLLVEKGGKSAYVVLGVPIRSPDGRTFALRAVLKRDALVRILNEQAWPSDWTASVVDQNDVIVARSRDSQRYVGQQANASVIEGLRDGRAQFEASTNDGQHVLVSTADIPGTGWHVVVGQPVAALEEQLRSSMALIVGGGLVCVILGIGGSLYLTREVSTQARAAAESHAQGRESELPAGAVVEVHQLATALRRSESRTSRIQADLEDARHDALTGLPGRALFMERAHRLIESCEGDHDVRAVALLFVDLDGFKQVNDRLGHDAGDRVLREVAEILRGCVRADDVVGRLGGDEFVVCISAPWDQLQTIALAAASRMVEAVGSVGESIGCSIGTAFAYETAQLDALIERADHAMLDAKRAGKNRVLVAA